LFGAFSLSFSIELYFPEVWVNPFVHKWLTSLQIAMCQKRERKKRDLGIDEKLFDAKSRLGGIMGKLTGIKPSLWL